MQRYFVKNSQIKDDEIVIIAKDHHHIKNVMRMRLKDQVEVCNEEGDVFLAEIRIFNKDNLVLKMISKLNVNSELNAEVTIALGLAKKSKHEEVIRRITELGAKRFIPVELTRSVVKLNKAKTYNIERFETIVKEAAEQSKRTKLLKVNNPITFKELLNNLDNYDYFIYAYENLKDSNNKEKLTGLIKGFLNKRVLILVGPEGGFTHEEVKILDEKGFIAIGLGRRILRLETAAIYIMSVISYELEL